jgi:hypothetical protein
MPEYGISGPDLLFVEKAVRLLSVILLLGVLIPATACGSGRSVASPSGFVSGNWQVTLNATTTVVFTGFLSQSSNSVTGSLLLASTSECGGVGSVTGTGTGQNVSGTVNGQNVSLNLNQSGAIIGLTGTAASGTSGSMTGDFTSQPGVCGSIPTSGTWSAVQIARISGSFQGSFTSSVGNGGVVVRGSLNQGPNTADSTATLSGTLTLTSPPTFCSYMSPGPITGLISGTLVQLNLYGENGLQYAQLGGVGIGLPEVTVTADGKSLTGPYSFPGGPPGSTCPGDKGTFNLSFSSP